MTSVKARSALTDPGALLEELPSAVCTCNPDGLLSFYNAKAAELWGRQPGLLDPTQRYCGSLRLWRTDGGELDHAESPMAQTLRHGRSLQNQQVIIERPDASRVTVTANTRLTLDEFGKISGAVNVFSETDRRPAEVKSPFLPEEGVYRLIDALGVAVYTTDPGGRILAYNQRAVDLWGREPDKSKDRWCGSWRIYTPEGEIVPLDQCPMAVAVKEARSVRDVEIVIERPDGTQINVLPMPTPLWDEHGTLVGGVNVLVDVTDRTHAQTEARLLAAIVESSSDSVISKGLDGVIKTWNPASERLFGYKANEAVGKSMRLIVPDDRWAEEQEIITRVARGQRIIDLETVRRHKDGTLIPVSLTDSPVRTPKGQVIGASTISREIAARKAAEEALRNALAVKDEFIGLISHELKNPITVILGFSRLLSRNYARLAQEEMRQSLDAIAAEAEKLKDNIDHLLLLSRLETRKPNLYPVPLSRAVMDAVQQFRDTHAREVILMDGISELPSVQADEVLLGIVLQNLLTNAAKYSPPEADITVSGEQDADSNPVVHVLDKGIGLTDEDVHHLFTPFYRSDAARETASGLGLGLTVCRRAIEAMGGSISAKGAAGQGSDFFFTLPGA